MAENIGNRVRNLALSELLSFRCGWTGPDPSTIMEDNTRVDMGVCPPVLERAWDQLRQHHKVRRTLIDPSHHQNYRIRSF